MMQIKTQTQFLFIIILIYNNKICCLLLGEFKLNLFIILLLIFINFLTYFKILYIYIYIKDSDA